MAKVIELLDLIPKPDLVRMQLARVLQEVSLLKKLIKVAEEAEEVRKVRDKVDDMIEHGVRQ